MLSLLLIACVLFTSDTIRAINKESCGKGTTSQFTFIDSSCYYTVAPDGLPYADGGVFLFPENSIFFLETSCKGGLNNREACSIESAAKAHPNRQVIVLFTGPVSKFCLESEPMASVISYKNVQFYRINLLKYVEGTPLESIFLTDRFNRSHNPVYHAASLLKYLTLYKYGGIYLDLDVLVLKSFDDLPEPRNWVGLEDDLGQEVGTALIAASTAEPGRLFIETAINILKNRYNPVTWIHDSGNLIKNVLRMICSTPLLLKMTVYTCQGFAVYPVNFFYQLNLKQNRESFFEYGYQYNVKYSFAIHLMQAVTSTKVIYENSTYAKLMFGTCSQVYRETVLVPDAEAAQQSSETTPKKTQDNVKKMVHNREPLIYLSNNAKGLTIATITPDIRVYNIKTEYDRNPTVFYVDEKQLAAIVVNKSENVQKNNKSVKPLTRKLYRISNKFKNEKKNHRKLKRKFNNMSIIRTPQEITNSSDSKAMKYGHFWRRPMYRLS